MITAVFTMIRCRPSVVALSASRFLVCGCISIRRKAIGDLFGGPYA